MYNVSVNTIDLNFFLYIVTAINCGGLSPPLHGDVTFTSTYYTSQANYSCAPAYKLQGVKTRTCQSNSQWSDTPPTCTSKTDLCTLDNFVFSLSLPLFNWHNTNKYPADRCVLLPV